MRSKPVAAARPARLHLLERRRLLSNTLAGDVVAGFTGGSGGRDPAGALIADPAGDLFGVTPGGVTADGGTVFEVAAGTGLVTTLATFPAGVTPVGPLVRDAAGDLFGATAAGGAAGDGSVFELPAGSAVPVTLASFDETDGATPAGGVVADAAGDLFGITTAGGPDGLGVVYEVRAPATAPALVDLATADLRFTALPRTDADGGSTFLNPLAVAPDGSLFGTTIVGPVVSTPTSGTAGTGPLQQLGSAFRIDPDGGAYDRFTTLATFTVASGFDEEVFGPYGAPVLDAAGDVFTLAYTSVTDAAVLVEVPAGGGPVVTVHQFPGTGQAAEPAFLSADAAGDLLGVGTPGGFYINAQPPPDVLFEFPGGTGPFTVVADAEVAVPAAPLVAAADGRLFGVTEFAGGDLDGAVVVYGPTGTATETTTNLTAGSAAAVLGGTVRMTAAVSPVPAGGGTVTFLFTPAGGTPTPFGTAALAADGTATADLPTAPPGAGPASITARFGGTATLAPSTSAAAAVTVAPGPVATSLTLAASVAGPVDLGQPVTFTATLAVPDDGLPGGPTGTVSFATAAGASLGAAALTAQGTATLTTSTLPAGVTAVTAAYGGDAQYAPSTAPAATVTVIGPGPFPASPTTDVPTPVMAGAAVRGSVGVTLRAGSDATRGRVRLDVLAGGDSATAVAVASVDRAVRLTAGGSAAVTVPLRSIPAALPPGTYPLLVRTTDAAGRANVAVASGELVVTAAPTADLSATVAAASGPAASPSSFRVTVTNTGGADAVGRLVAAVVVTDGQGRVTTLATAGRAARVRRGGGAVSVRLSTRRISRLPAGSYVPVVRVTLGPFAATVATGVTLAGAG